MNDPGTLDIEKLAFLFEVIDESLLENDTLSKSLNRVSLERSGLEGLNTRRSEIEILAFILKAARKGVNKTSILYQANLSGKQLKNYLLFLTTGGFLRNDPGKRSNVYFTTGKGSQFLYHWAKILQLLESGQ